MRSSIPLSTFVLLALSLSVYSAPVQETRFIEARRFPGTPSPPPGAERSRLIAREPLGEDLQDRDEASDLSAGALRHDIPKNTGRPQARDVAEDIEARRFPGTPSPPPGAERSRLAAREPFGEELVEKGILRAGLGAGVSRLSGTAIGREVGLE